MSFIDCAAVYVLTFRKRFNRDDFMVRALIPKSLHDGVFGAAYCVSNSLIAHTVFTHFLKIIIANIFTITSVVFS